MEQIKFTRNEKKTLKLLLEDAKMSDSAIATRLHISSQAVGKIRRKLEKTIIDSYTLQINYVKLGIHTFAIAISKVTPEGIDKGIFTIEQRLMDDPHVLQVYRLPTGNTTYVVLYGFRDVTELDYYFHSPHQKRALHNYLENNTLHLFSHNSLLKNNANQLFIKVIDDFGVDLSEMGFKEIEKYKRKL